MDKDMTTFSVGSNILSHSDFSQDDRFMRVKLSLCTHNQKANGMHFDRQLIESKLNQIDFMPIVGKISIVEKEDGTVKYCLGSHEVELDIVDNELVYKKNTIVLGVALPNTAKFETITRHDSSEEYVTFEALLFQEKYPQLKTVVNLDTDASMELDNMEAEYDEDNGWYDVKDFRFLAHCLLGVQPAFKLAGVVQQFSLDDFKLEFSDMLEEIKSSLNRCNNNEEEKGGDDVEEEIKVEEATTEELEQEVEVTVETEVEDVVQEVEVEADVETQEMANEEDGSDEESEEEMARKKRAKCEEESSEEVDETDYKAEYELIKVELEQAKVEMSELQEKFNTISKEYQAKIDAETLAEKQKVIASYSDSLTEEEINSVITDVTAFSVEDVDTKLAAYLGKKIKQDKSKQEDTTVFSNLETNFANNSKWSGWLSKM